VKIASQRGSVTVVTAAIAGVMMVLTLGAADLGKVLISRERAHAAADAAALAAAQELALGSGATTPALQAADFAGRNGAVLTSCVCDRGTLEAIVTVDVPVGHLFLIPGDRTIRADSKAVVDLPQG
jgi:secretion/DNA translocation related TadE-like protein